MDEATRQSILARIRRDAASIGESDRDLIERAMTIILKMASDPVSGPLTFLMPETLPSKGSTSKTMHRSRRSFATGASACCSTRW